MEQGEARYEVIFTLEPVVSDEPRGRFHWTWVGLRADGLVTVRGKIYPDLRAAIDAAATYRRDHGNGEIGINIRETRYKDAPDAVYL